MSKILIIAEKPDMAKKIYTALSKGKLVRNDGYSEDNAFVFTNAIGHLLRLATPNEVDPKYNVWNIKNLPFEFSSIPLVVSDSVKKQFSVVKKLLARNDISEVINACDSDREGEYIFRNIILGAKIKFDPKVKFTRLWISSTTKEGVEEAFKNRRPSSEYNLLGQSAKGRSYADYHIGLNATIAMTSAFGKGKEVISVGRVQTPTLKIIVDREREIEQFKSKKFYTIKGDFLTQDTNKFVADFVPQLDDKNEFEDKAKCDKIISQIKTGDYKVIEVKETKKTSSHKQLYALSDLQVDMSSRYGYSAQEVLDTVQSLYEKHSLVTYPRTDENHVSPEWAKKLSSVVLEKLSDLFGIFTREIQNNAYTLDSRCVAKKESIGAHEALTPTEKKITKEEYEELTTKEKNVYKAIVYRFLTCFYPDAIDKVVSYKFNNGFDTFRYAFTKEVDPGFRKVAIKNDEKEDNDTIVLSLKQGDIVSLVKAYAKEKVTQPPKRFTEGSLIKEMKNPAKYLENKEDKELIKKVEGIGTEATRASIIESLKKRNYIETSGKQIVPTQKGKNFINVFPSDLLKSIELTVEFERKLELIAEGKLTFKEFMTYVYELDDKLISDISSASKTSSVDLSSNEEEICKCPFCGSPIVEHKNCYSCKNKSCNTVIFKDQLKKSLNYKKITKKQAVELFTKGKTSKKARGFVSKSGKKYTAYLTYSKNKESKFPNTVWITFE